MIAKPDDRRAVITVAIPTAVAIAAAVVVAGRPVVARPLLTGFAGARLLAAWLLAPGLLAAHLRRGRRCLVGA